ncbi:hypothetical protein ACU4GD_07775 [Cupriavidus basilensis]
MAAHRHRDGPQCRHGPWRWKRRETHGALLAALLFASGASALVYQVLWVKQVALIVGVDVYAATTGVSAVLPWPDLRRLGAGRRADRAATAA